VRGEKMAEKLFSGLTFEQVVDKYAQTVFRVCVMRLDNYADAEDCFQNVFVKLFKTSPRFNEEEHIKAWLIRVAINECGSYIKANRRDVPMERIQQDRPAFTDDSADISWALMRTPQKYREVLYLYYCEQYKVSEIAAILKVNENTVKTRLKRGRVILKSIYGGD
jgi:RNA polymerase sigma-70 factor (ECF subfamily)